jgi:hypothetical protein
MKKKTAAAMETNWIRAVMKEPYRNLEWWRVKVRLLKSVLPTIAPMIGSDDVSDERVQHGSERNAHHESDSKFDQVAFE